VGKGGERVNMVQILCTHVCKWKKMRPIETSLRMRGRKRRAVEGVNSSMTYLIQCKNFCKPTVYPTQHKKNKKLAFQGWQSGSSSLVPA
jgi:hypothetical protein